MKRTNLFIVCMLALVSAGTATAQSTKKNIDKKVEFKNDNGKQTLTIITSEDGKEKKEVYTGAEAERKMEELNSKGSDAHFKVWIEDEKNGGDDANVHLFNSDGQMSVIHKDGKVIIKKIDKDGKEEIEEIDLDQSVEKAMEDLHFNMDSGAFTFDLNQAFDAKKFEEQMERFSKDMELNMKAFSDKSYIIKEFDPNGGNDTKVILKEDTETLSPEEIKAKYGVEVDGDNSTVVIKKIITVKKDGSTTGSSSQDKLKVGELDVYPNPSKGDFTLKYNSAKGGLSAITVKDLNGRIVFQSEYNTKGPVEKKLGLTHLPAGAYTVTLKNGENTTTQKIVIE